MLPFCRPTSGGGEAARSSPIFFEPSHRRRVRVFDLEPVRRAPGAIGRPEALRHDTLAAERGGVLEDHGAVAVKCSLRAMPSCGSRRSPASRRIRSSVGSGRMSSPFTSADQRRTGQRAGAVAVDEIERGKPIVVTDDRLAVDDKRTNGQRLDRLWLDSQHLTDHVRKTKGPVCLKACLSGKSARRSTRPSTRPASRSILGRLACRPRNLSLSLP